MGELIPEMEMSTKKTYRLTKKEKAKRLAYFMSHTGGMYVERDDKSPCENAHRAQTFAYEVRKWFDEYPESKRLFTIWWEEQQ